MSDNRDKRKRHAEYMRLWNARNQERVNTQRQKRREQNKEKINSQNRAWRIKHIDECRMKDRLRGRGNQKKRAQERNWQIRNRERVNLNHRAAYQRNPERRRSLHSAWAKKNKEKVLLRGWVYNAFKASPTALPKDLIDIVVLNHELRKEILNYGKVNEYQ